MRMCPNIHGRRALRYGLSEGEWGANELMTGIYFNGLIAQWSVFSLVRSNCSYEKSSDYMVFKLILNIQWQKIHEGLLPIPGKKFDF